MGASAPIGMFDLYAVEEGKGGDVRSCGRARLCGHVQRAEGKVTREEFEYPIAYGEAEEMLAHALGVIEKTRYEIEFQGAYWEIDVFAGAHRGLATAEIELADPDDEPSMPPWLGPEIVGKPPYSNRGLALKAG